MNNIGIEVKDVISFKYTNAKIDDTPLVLVTDISNEHVCGYNLNYFNDGLEFNHCYRKYLRIYIEDATNLTRTHNDILKKSLSTDALDGLGIGEEVRDIGGLNWRLFLVSNRDFVLGRCYGGYIWHAFHFSPMSSKKELFDVYRRDRPEWVKGLRKVI